jgi:hypothetical protein
VIVIRCQSKVRFMAAILPLVAPNYRIDLTCGA